MIDRNLCQLFLKTEKWVDQFSIFLFFAFKFSFSLEIQFHLIF